MGQQSKIFDEIIHVLCHPWCDIALLLDRKYQHKPAHQEGVGRILSEVTTLTRSQSYIVVSICWQQWLQNEERAASAYASLVASFVVYVMRSNARGESLKFLDFFWSRKDQLLCRSRMNLLRLS